MIFKKDLVPVSFFKDPNAPVEPILPKSSNVNSTGNRQFVSHGDFHEENLSPRSIMCFHLKIHSKIHWVQLSAAHSLKVSQPVDEYSMFKVWKEGDEQTKTITFLMTYNKNDWTTGGWVHFLEGYTIYLSSVDDLAFSPTDGILVSDVSRGIPIVTIREERHILRLVSNLRMLSCWWTVAYSLLGSNNHYFETTFRGYPYSICYDERHNHD